MSTIYRVDDLRQFASDLLHRNRLPPDMAKTVADVLLEGDLLGHTT
jgi:LDH2 family malate/lactate/ureidoglycolate dehydrogenase